MSWLRDKADNRAGFAVLAMLALLMQLAVPQGFMLARDAGQPVIVICTGHGPLLVPTADRGIPAKAPKPGGTCAFAGHGGTPTVAPALLLAVVRFEPAIAIAPPGLSTTPGRGLAAPPPPSQAPPAASI
jgi:hypothetical protein